MCSRTFRLSAALLLSAGLFQLAAMETRPEPARVEGPSGRLVRVDLLRRPPAADVRVLRNIFMAGGSAAETFPGMGGPPPGKGLFSDTARGAAGRPSAPTADIRYIGWVTASRKTVALIYTGSEVLAVSEGSTFGDGFVVRRIGPEALEVETSDGQVLTVSIEGER